MLYNICCLYIIFFIFSCIGYFVEVAFCSLQEKRIIWNRGFLLGPYIPIYGVGATLIVYFLSKYYNDPLAFFCLTVIMCSTIEYLTSFFMEKLFKVRWWDYSKERFNINGRVCLTNSILFGFGGMIVQYLIMPHIYQLIKITPTLHLCVIALICFIIFITDLIVTTNALFKVKSTLLTFKELDVTELAKEEVIKSITKHEFSFDRIIKAFPKIGIINNKSVADFRELVLKAKKILKENKQKRTDKRKRQKEELLELIDKIKNKTQK
ncbi:MAG: putative ABC transporter permease [Bacilli bacterium]|nr:putative ABC transporter permease [Bacilli bacterium]